MWAWLTAIGFTMFIGLSVGNAARENNPRAIQLGGAWFFAIWAVMFFKREWLSMVTWGVLILIFATALGIALTARKN